MTSSDPSDFVAILDALDIPAQARVQRVLQASDFARDVLQAQPELLQRLLDDDVPAVLPFPALTPDNRDDWPRLLRRHRVAASTRLIWRDVLGLDDVDATLAGSSRLAEECLQGALTALQEAFEARHGVVRNVEGTPQRLVVFGLGKLGGGELNFSSDIDIVYAYEEDGDSDGARPLPAELYFARLGQQLAKLLDEVTVDGFSHRVDLRLRPYGSAGRLAWSFSALEQYFQREGRDWERYAWQKARPVAGDIEAGDRFLHAIRPFVYRRYLDFGALEGLREMKALIAAEVARRDMADDIKRGPGGIREIEFLAQALQLIHGGRTLTLQVRGLLPALAALRNAGLLQTAIHDALLQAYRFLRRLENRLQMLRDAQTYRLPDAPAERERLATGLGYADWPALLAALDAERAVVSREFAALLAARSNAVTTSVDAVSAYWRALPEGGDVGVLAQAGLVDVDAADAALRHFARTAQSGGLSEVARARLDRLMPALIAAAAKAAQPDAALPRALALVQNVLRRSSYLALLDEQPQALARLLDALSRSALLGERLAAYPLLLDELLDARVAGTLPDRDAMHAACRARVAAAGDDVEIALRDLNETRQAISFRIALAALDDREPAALCTQRLAWLADAVVEQVVALAMDDVAATHGRVPGAQFAVIGYGSVGGEELGFGSDLDLVFLYDADEDTLSDGRRPLEAQRWFARVGQKIVGLLQTPTAAGRLYDVDVRLRPDGGKGLLVSSLASYADYQRNRAWTWEHQALVRARALTGDAGLQEAFEEVRRDILIRPRDPAQLWADVTAMRQKMRAQLDRSTAAVFDLKQGEGGLVDLEFLLQANVLAHAVQHPALTMPRRSVALLQALAATGVLPQADAEALLQAHAVLARAGLRCTLDRKPRRVPLDDAIDAARAVVAAACHAAGWEMAAPGETSG